MKKSRFTETQIVTTLKRYENCQPVADLVPELGITTVSL